MNEFYWCDNSNLGKLPPESVHLTVTSPPYVTTTFKKGQDFEYDQFLEHLSFIFEKIYSVTVPGGRFALNVADILTKYRYKDDDVMGRAALGPDSVRIAQECGWRLLERFIWDKGFTRNFGGPLLGTYPYPNTIFNNNYFEYIWVFRKPGKRSPVKQSVRELSRLTLEDWRASSQQWWRVESISEKLKFHPAVFPIEIPARLIKMFSYVGDTVLDPWAGTGATAIAGHCQGRSTILFENSKEFPQWISKRIDYEKERHDLSSFEFEIRKEI